MNESGLLKGVTETVKNEAKEQKGGFLGMLVPRQHLLILKTSWGRLQDMSWRRLQHIFSIIIFRLADISKTSRKTSWRRVGRRKMDTRKRSSRRPEEMSWRHLQDMSSRRPEDMFWRHLQDFLETKKWRISESNKSKCAYIQQIYISQIYILQI